MMNNSQADPTIQTDVLIIGADPTGLALACQFVRYGVDFVMIEKREGVTGCSNVAKCVSNSIYQTLEQG
jgi:cation diffusion facilitator CzcD-associated flavoprotein CzcO